MFPKAILTFLVIGALSVNALVVPVARSPAPEPDSQELEAWMLKRDLSYDLFSRELQALDELFSREPKNWAEWAKREPSPGNVIQKVTDKVTDKVAGPGYLPANHVPGPAPRPTEDRVISTTGPQTSGVVVGSRT